MCICRQAALIVFVLFLCGAVAAQEGNTAQDAESRAADLLLSSWAFSAQSPAGLLVPPPISRHEIARYKTILNLSDAQGTLLDRLHSSYAQQCIKLQEEHGPPIVAAATQLAELNGQFGTAAAHLQLRQLEDQFVASLCKLEQNMLGQLMAALTEQQLEKLDRVRLHRDRRSCSTLMFYVSKSKLDISRIIEELRLPADAMNAIEEMLYEYEIRVTPAIIEADKLHKQSAPQMTNLQEAGEYDAQGNRLNLDRNSPETIEWFRQGREAQLRVYARRAIAERRIARVNDDMLPQILTLLSPAEARRVQDTYNARAYRRVYPDNTAPDALVTAVVGSDQLTHEQSEALTSMFSEYRRKHDRLNNTMKDAIDSWRDLLAFTYSPSGWQEHHTLMADSLKERVGLNESLLNEVIEYLGPPQLVDQQAMIAQLRAAIDSERASLDRPIMNVQE
jgi:hypothetical protein